MVSRIRQKTKLSPGSSTVINNTYPNKRVRIKHLPPGSKVTIKKKFLDKSLKSRIAKIKSSSQYRAGLIQYKKKAKTS